MIIAANNGDGNDKSNNDNSYENVNKYVVTDDAHVDAFSLPEQVGFWLGSPHRCC